VITTEHRYEIGGICVRMTESQAAAWNAGFIDADIMRGALAHIPGDGMVDFWTAIYNDGQDTQLYSDLMKGMRANRIGGRA
jgi:hypothetical protein